VTSREALRVAGEICYRVPSLENPKPGIEISINELSKMESVKLFAERASSISAGFAITSHNASSIAQICQSLDGIPLAIELAAALVVVLSPQQILTRLDDRFNLLTDGLRSALPRHQTLRATIEWSYDLLSKEERILFSRLSVFVGGWTLEAAEEICSGNGIDSKQVLGLITHLINKSLVIVEIPVKETRYRRLETIHQFARGKLLESGETPQLRDRHMEYFLKKAEEIELFLIGPDQSAWMDYLDLELDNIRLAMEWALSNKRGDESLRLFGALGWYCFIHCYCWEGLEWFKRALELRNGVSKRVQAKALKEAGWLYYTQGDLSAIISCHRENLDFYRELDDMKEIANALQFLGVIEFERRNLVQSRAYLEESLNISRKINNKPTMPRVLKQLSFFFQIEGDYDTAWRYCEEALAISWEIQEGYLTMVVLRAMGYLAFTQKNTSQARGNYREALEIALGLKNKRSIADSLLDFAEIMFTEAQYVQSTHLLGFADTLLKEAYSFNESRMSDFKRIADIPRTYLGEDSFQKAFDIGKMFNLEQAIEIALKQPS